MESPLFYKNDLEKHPLILYLIIVLIASKHLNLLLHKMKFSLVVLHSFSFDLFLFQLDPILAAYYIVNILHSDSQACKTLTQG